MATSFVLTASGRVLRDNAPDRSTGPRLYLAGCQSANLVRIRHDVGQATACAIEALVCDEPPLCEPDSTPVHLEEYIRLLAAEAPIEHSNPALTWCFPDHLQYEHDVRLVGSDTPEGERLLADLAERGVPQAMVDLGFVTAADFWPPWCVAIHECEIASIAFAARLGPTGAATGVVTVPAFRGRGLAAAATAGWASLQSLAGRALFYSANRTNVSSRRVAERLGLRFLGASLSVG